MGVGWGGALKGWIKLQRGWLLIDFLVAIHSIEKNLLMRASVVVCGLLVNRRNDL